MEAQDRQLIHLLNSITDVSLRTFGDRMKLQKLTYLAREVGYDCGLSFDWYVRGPYSPSLTRVLFSAEEIGELAIDNTAPDQNEREIIRSLQELMGEGINDPNELELIASVWYVLPEGNLSADVRERILEFLADEKPHFSQEQFEDAIERIQRFRRGE
jgi:hypothetical protein